MQMVEYIKELLRFHDYVIIPELGGFISHYEPAKRNISTATIAAPSKKIAFNQSLKENDGLLVNHLVSQKNISQEKAKALIAAFIKEIHVSLESNGEFNFDGIGRFQLDNRSNIQFYPILKENLLLGSFGLERVIAQPIQRIKEAFEESKRAEEVVLEVVQEHTVELETAHIDINQEKVYRPWYFRAAAVIGMGFLMTTVGMSMFSGNLSGEQLSLFPVQQQKVEVFEAVQAEIPSLDIAQPKVSDVHLYEAIAEEEVAVSTDVVTSKEVVSNHTTTNSYNIVIGSFLNETRMNREIANMQAQGFTVKTLEGPNGYTRVALVFDSATAPKYRTLHKIRATVNVDAWMIGA